jgi:hypothetical protein
VTYGIIYLNNSTPSQDNALEIKESSKGAFSGQNKLLAFWFEN